MQRILKYKLQDRAMTLEDRSLAVAMMPKSAKIISCGAQGDDLYLWAEILVEQSADAEKDLSERKFDVLMTGPMYPVRPWTFIGTVQMQSGLVFHIYERHKLIL